MTHKLLYLTLFLAFITTTKSVNACPDWYAQIIDAKPAAWDWELNPQGIAVVDDPLGVKGKMTKFTITAKSTWPNGHTRVELKHQGCNTDEGETTYIAWEFFLEKPFNSLNDIAYWESDGSYKQTMGFSIAPGGMHNLNKNIIRFFSRLPDRRVHWQYPIKIGAWHQLAMAVRWSESVEQGEVSVWFDKKKVVDRVKVQTKADHNTLFIQLGLHRDQAEIPEDSIYISNVHEGRNIEDLLN
ncbi:MAG: hypothetical protein ACI88A_002016 [Paraglaciecola sp.]|jgi:hypothetical protein